jgi:rhodanese-related sulfurtransferase
MAMGNCPHAKKEKCGSDGCAIKDGKQGDGHKQCPVAKDGQAVVNTSALAALIKAKVPLVILDARAGKYDDGRRVPGAQSLNANSKDEEIAKAIPDKNALVVTYCAGLTCPASGMLAEKLTKLGYNNVIEYPEGIEGWAKAGNSITQTGGK